METELVIAKIRKNGGAELWVVAKRFNGKLLCDLREYFQPADTPGWLPTKKGVSIPPELLGQVVDAFEELASRTAPGVVREISRGQKAKLCFAICEYQKNLYADIRIFFTESTGGEWKHGKGVTVPLSKLTQVAEALRLAEDEIEKLPAATP